MKKKSVEEVIESIQSMTSEDWNNVKAPFEMENEIRLKDMVILLIDKDNSERYVLTDETGTYMRLYDRSNKELFNLQFLQTLFKFDDPEDWPLYEGSQELLEELIDEIEIYR